jgi:pantetheine-phosphate adenylyltransferase
VFLAPATDLTFVSSTLVREVARFGGDVRPLVPPAVEEALRRKFTA